MVEPDDFALGPLATLSHTADTRRTPSHGSFWSHWDERITTPVPVLSPRREVDPSDPTATHEFLSVRHVRIGCRLLEPADPSGICAGIVMGHGYADPEPLEATSERHAPPPDRPVAMLCLRLRGYPASCLDCGPLTSDWGRIAHGIEGLLATPPKAGDWIVADWTADLALACVALVRHLERRTRNPVPIFLRGESLSGGLAVLAAARLSGLSHLRLRIERLVLANPSLADWPWRLRRIPPDRALGAGGDLARCLRDLRAPEDAILAALRLFDPVVHARRLICPVLCRLALRDEVVPAPTAAAVYNALGTDPGRRWRFVTRYGHHEGGLAHARRYALFERCCADFLDPATPPEEAMAPWEGIASDPGRAAP